MEINTYPPTRAPTNDGHPLDEPPRCRRLRSSVRELRLCGVFVFGLRD